MLTFLLAALTLAAPPTWSNDVAPLVFAKCAACHRPDNVGPFPLLSYADAKKKANLIARVTAKRTMPPWMPSAGWGEFHANRSLTDAQIATFKAWADAGAPEGDASHAPAPPKFKEGWQLGKPDVILEMDKAFAVPAEGRDVYHHFVFPLNLKGDTYLRAVECIPGNRKVAHHAVGILDASGTARRLAQKHDGSSYPGNAPGFLPAGFTPGYAPGQTPAFFAEGEAITLKKGTDFVLQMHYSPTGKAESDKTKIGLYFTKTPPKRNVGIIMLGSLDIDIASGTKSYTRTDSFTLPVDYEFRSVWGHMHLIGKEMKVWAVLPDKRVRRLLWIKDWDFNWQDTYQYKSAFVLPKGTTIKAEFTWDNSAENPRNPASPPKRVLNGEQSADEMAGLILGGRPVRVEDEGWAWLAVIGHYFEVEGKKKRK